MLWTAKTFWVIENATTDFYQLKYHNQHVSKWLVHNQYDQQYEVHFDYQLKYPNKNGVDS